MTRKHYEAIARALRDERPDETVALLVWETIVRRLARTLSDQGGFDLNGNRRFDMDRFLKAAGFAS